MRPSSHPTPPLTPMMVHPILIERLPMTGRATEPRSYRNRKCYRRYAAANVATTPHPTHSPDTFVASIPIDAARPPGSPAYWDAWKVRQESSGNKAQSASRQPSEPHRRRNKPMCRMPCSPDSPDSHGSEDFSPRERDTDAFLAFDTQSQTSDDHSSSSGLPLALLQIDTPTLCTGSILVIRRHEYHSLIFQQLMLTLLAAKSKPRCQRTIAEHHTMTGNNPWLRIRMQREPNESCISRRTGQCRHLPIRGHLPGRNTLHHLVHPLRKRLFHATHYRHTPQQAQQVRACGTI